MNKAIVVEGGAMRGVFAAGVLDVFMHRKHQFDFAIGVSAGATNLATYVSQIPGLSRTIITEYATRREFFSPLRFIRGGHMTDVHWLWHQCRQQLDSRLPEINTAIPLYVGVTNVDTGQCDYLRAQPDNIDDLMVASCSIPMAYRDQPKIGEHRYVDGGVADAIPVKKAYEMGAREITVVLSQPLGFSKPTIKSPWLFERLYGHQPQLMQTLLSRPGIYNETLAFLKNPPADLALTLVAPPADFQVKRLTMDKKKLTRGYKLGKIAALKTLKAQRLAAA
ncbi:patatin family protein [Salinimonas sp. HHU 13199]|uniref:Patatin family protein n=1 Tax=Salinimonas profundi TaxID=2729140 RepID=A0ABR8LQX5_9ALTE|nr:patatin family protein [Salinimonas profundi]MBD3586489.1 patatin family protein [Salinimonas profundi]